mmetsp:Transcript_38856/g.37191  ORF Transcript_38856/g.37191 Transcript_38856/m.37191 type:complete len:99 (-) Transcript_38856:70-366(-)
MMSGFYSIETFQKIRQNYVGNLFSDILKSMRTITKKSLQTLESDGAFKKFWEMSQNDQQVQEAIRKILITNIRFQTLNKRVEDLIEEEKEETKEPRRS